MAVHARLVETDLILAKEDFKFNAAHFTVHGMERERLHGHNYRVEVVIHGGEVTSGSAMLMDFSVIKPSIREVCKSLDGRFMCPTKCPHVEVTQKDGQVTLRCADGSYFSFPLPDVTFLPVENVTVEALADWIAHKVLGCLGGTDKLLAQHAHGISVTVSETPGQGARRKYLFTPSTSTITST